MNRTSLFLYAALSAPLFLTAACAGDVTVAANGGDAGGTGSTDASGGGTVFTDAGGGGAFADAGGGTFFTDAGSSGPPMDAGGGGAGFIDAGGWTPPADAGTGTLPDGGSVCDTLPGDALVLTNARQAADSFAGSWLVCAGRGKPIFPPDVIGVEFGPAGTLQTFADGGVSGAGGTLYLLIQGPTGPVRGNGYTYTYTYDVYDEGAGWFQMDIHPAPNSGFGGGFKVSANPRWITMNNDFDPFTISFAGI